MTQNDRISIENETLFLCSLAVISLRIPWASVPKTLRVGECHPPMGTSRRAANHGGVSSRFRKCPATPLWRPWIDGGAGTSKLLKEATAKDQHDAPNGETNHSRRCDDSGEPSFVMCHRRFSQHSDLNRRFVQTPACFERETTAFVSHASHWEVRRANPENDTVRMGSGEVGWNQEWQGWLPACLLLVNVVFWLTSHRHRWLS
jgi:hypothetical protein